MKFTVIRDFATVIREFDDPHAAMRCASALCRFDSDSKFAVISPDGAVAVITVVDNKTTLNYPNGMVETWDYKRK